MALFDVFKKKKPENQVDIDDSKDINEGNEGVAEVLNSDSEVVNEEEKPTNSTSNDEEEERGFSAIADIYKEIEAEKEEEAKRKEQSMFNKLKKGLQKTRTNFSGGLGNIFSGFSE